MGFDGDSTTWSDHNSNGKDFRDWSENPWKSGNPPSKMQADGITVVRFHKNAMISTAAYPVPRSLTIFAVVKWNGNGGNWDPLVAVSHNRYWTIRHYSSTMEFNLHVRNEQEPRL